MKKFFLLLNLCCISFAAWADEYTDENGVKWNFYTNENVWDEPTLTNINAATIEGCKNYGTDIVVPSTIHIGETEYKVVGIANSPFNVEGGNPAIIRTVTLPSSIRTIGWHTFSGLNSLQSINIPEEVASIYGYAFSGCTNLTLTLPTSLQSIGEYAFQSCNTVCLQSEDPAKLGDRISSAHMFDGVKHIAVPDEALEAYKASTIWNTYAANICTQAEVVEYTHTDGNGTTWTYCYVSPTSSVRIIRAEGYTTSLDIPATLPYKEEQQLPVTAVEYSFANDENIVSVDLSKTSITTMPSFSDCSSLSTVSLPSTLESIGEYAFQNCDNLRSIDLSATKVKEIKSYAFSSCDNLATIYFPTTLECIANNAFESCRKIKSIDLSNTKLTTIGEYAFMYCYELTPLSLPATLKKIGAYAFFDNYALRDLDLSMVEEIGDEAFRFANVTTVDISSAKSIGATAFSNDVTFTINATTPATIKANSFSENSKFIVSPDAYNAFCSANIWKSWADNISMYTIDSDNIKWIYRYLADSNSMCITAASGYGKEVTVPSTLPYNGSNLSVTQIEGTFNGAEITSVVLPATLAHIGDYAFAYSRLSVINIPASVTTIGSHAFYYGNLASVTFEPNSVLESIGDYAFAGHEWDADSFGIKIASIVLPASVKNIGEGAFQYCRYLKSIDLSKVETIGDYAFYSTNLNSVDLSSAKTIGNNAFTGETFFSIDNAVPATIESGAFSTSATFLVPGSAVADYKTANVWSDYASRIFASNIAKQTINVTAESNTSAVLTAIGGSANQTSVIDLKVIGTINSYDIVVLHDKMVELRYLDLSEARIVANPYCYYENYCTEDDVLGPNSFREKSRLISIKLPAEIKSIGYNTFYNCQKLSEVVIPNSVTRIESEAFFGCYSLQSITLPNKLEYIGRNAFYGTGLKEIAFPTTLTRIEWGAFQGSQLETVRIPSSLQYVGGGAFQWCSNLKKVYTYTIEPTDINEETFSNFETAMLYVPVASGQNYYWDEGWKRFLNVAEFDEEYEYFYLNNDHTLDESTGAVDGTPDADLNAGSGLTVEEGVEQNMGDLNIQHDGTNGGSIIAGSEEGNIHADNLHVNINVESGRWYFFCFPFDLRKENISMGKEGTQYIFRWYDGKERANGNSGWKNVTEEEGSYLKAAVGYIFQCSQSDVLTISLKDVKFKKEKKNNELVANTAENLQDASWNFVGNPYLSYYDMSAIGYDAPITVWNGHTYEAIKPGDDDYHFAPFEAFFVQKPEGTNAMEFDADAQTTLKGSQEQQVTGARSITRAINPDRKLVNIVLNNGQKSDRTRIVFNNKVSMEYEMECDAAKFDAAGVPQLYTLDSRAVKYAINERPVAEGIVTLGYCAPTEGNYTLEAPRMDTPVYVRDNVTRVIHDFSEGNYEFYSEAGTFEGRFTILTRNGATGIDKVGLDEQQDEEIYNLNGQRVNKATGKGIYIKNNRKEVNM